MPVQQRSHASAPLLAGTRSSKALIAFLNDYKYQPALTAHLDGLSGRRFTQGTIDQIVLWKVNRYVQLQPKALAGLNLAQRTPPRHHRDIRAVLQNLLQHRGVDLAMASTMLRFRNPEAFQIIDRRAFRAVFGKPYPLRPHTGADTKIDLYFDYLDHLFALADSKNINFTMLDRLLYAFDKHVNGVL